MMRILCLGNMNNNLFVLARYLRDMGFEVDLMPQGYEHAHFQPACDTWDAKALGMVKSLGWENAPSLAKFNKDAFRNTAASYDFVIGCGFAPALMNACGLRLDLFIPYGSDLYMVPFPGHPDYACIQQAQRNGILETRNILWSFEPYRDIIIQMGYSGKLHTLSPPLVYTPILALQEEDTVLQSRFAHIRESSSPLIMHPTRHMWRTKGDPASLKANDVLLRGVALAYASNGGARPGVICFEYGPDVNASKALCAELGIEHAVHWFPVLARRQILALMQQCDIVATLFTIGGVICGSMCEGLACGKPLMGFREDHLHAERFPELYEIMNANTPGAVADLLNAWHDDPGRFQTMGDRGKQWHDTYCVRENLRGIASIIHAQAQA